MRTWSKASIKQRERLGKAVIVGRQMLIRSKRLVIERAILSGAVIVVIVVAAAIDDALIGIVMIATLIAMAFLQAHHVRWAMRVEDAINGVERTLTRARH